VTGAAGARRLGTQVTLRAQHLSENGTFNRINDDSQVDGMGYPIFRQAILDIISYPITFFQFHIPITFHDIIVDEISA
jgi:hypothetical protein